MITLNLVQLDGCGERPLCTAAFLAVPHIGERVEIPGKFPYNFIVTDVIFQVGRTSVTIILKAAQ